MNTEYVQYNATLVSSTHAVHNRTLHCSGITVQCHNTTSHLTFNRHKDDATRHAYGIHYTEDMNRHCKAVFTSTIS